MNLLKFFKREKASDASATAVAVAPPPISKPASERYGKTVMPNVPRYAEAESEPTSSPINIAPISLPSVASAAPRTISLGEKSVALPKIPAPVAAAPGGRAIPFLLSDIVPQIPAEVLSSAEIDPLQRVNFSAADLERGMANGRPAVLLREIFQQAPGIFAHQISAEDAREIALPFEKVLEQFTRLHVHGEQERVETGPEFETPFSQITREDRERFGTSSIEPVATKADAAPAPISLPKIEAAETPAPAAPSVLKLSPNGTGALACERVPASSESPVPTSFPAPIAPKIARQISLKPEPAQAEIPSHPIISDALATMPESKPDTRISLSLRAILKETLPFQYSGKVDEIPEETRIEFPLARVRPQLVSGKVEISAQEFHAALPEAFRKFFNMDDGGLPVQLPLAEVLQNLPNESLQLRGDQVETIVPQIFKTPFSQKAAEDAARLKIFSGPIEKAASPIAEEASAIPPAAEAPPERSVLQKIFQTEEEVDAKSIAAHVSRLPGVTSCAIVFSDGLSLAGNIPADYVAEALCATAPEIIKRIGGQVVTAGFGALRSITLHCVKSPVSFFAAGNICLAAVHPAGDLAPATRERLGLIGEELARMFTTSKPSSLTNA